MDRLSRWLAATIAVVAACVWGAGARGQCVRGWEAVGEMPGFETNLNYSYPNSGYLVTSWDPDADGPVPEVIIARCNRYAGSVRVFGFAAFEAGRWRDLRVPGQTLGAWHGGELLTTGLGVVSRYERARDSWESLTSAPEGALFIQPIGDGGFLLGGSFATWPEPRGLLRWHPETGSYTQVGNFDRISRLRLVDGRVFVTGTDDLPGGTRTSGVAVFDLGDGSWTFTPGLGYFEDVVDLDGELLSAGAQSLYRLDEDSFAWRHVMPLGQVIWGIAGLTGNRLLVKEAPGMPGNLVLLELSPIVRRQPLTQVKGYDAYSHQLRSGGVLLTGNVSTPEVAGNGVVIWSGDSMIPTVLGNGLPADPTALLSVDGGDVLIAGPFPSVGNLHTGGIVRWNPNTREFSSADAESLGHTQSLLRLRNGEIVAGGLTITGEAGVNRWNRTLGTWTSIGDRWPSVYGDSAVSVCELANGTLVSLYRGQLRFLREGETAWNLGPSLGSTGAGVLLSHANNEVTIGWASGVSSWREGEQTTRLLGSGFPRWVTSMLRTSQGELLAGGDTLRRFDVTANTWVSIPNTTARSVRAMIELDSGQILVHADDWGEYRGGNLGRLSLADGRWEAAGNLQLGESSPRLAFTLAETDVVVAGSFRYLRSFRDASPRLGIFRNYLAACPADVDCRTGLDADDIPVFFDAFDTGNMLADVDLDGDVDGDDVIAFWTAWDSGC